MMDNKRTSEIDKLIINSIGLFSDALKERNLHRRISNIFTIFESLLVKDVNAGIIQSLCKYGPKLAVQDLKERKELVNVFISLYKVRSSYVHHAKLNEFNIDDLTKLQKSISKLLSNIMILGNKYTTKDKLMEAIDIEIDKAFNLSEELK